MGAAPRTEMGAASRISGQIRMSKSLAQTWPLTQKVNG